MAGVGSGETDRSPVGSPEAGTLGAGKPRPGKKSDEVGWNPGNQSTGCLEKTVGWMLVCADEAESAACAALDGDLHVLTASTESALEEGVAQFHVVSHHHTVELDGSGWIWADTSGETMTIFTQATIALALADGDEQAVTAGDPNSECSDPLSTSIAHSLTEGRWDFLVEGSGEAAWIVVSLDAEGEHDHGEQEH